MGFLQDWRARRKLGQAEAVTQKNMLAVEKAVQAYFSWCREQNVRPDGGALVFVIVSTSGLSLGLTIPLQDPDSVSKYALVASQYAVERAREEGYGPPYPPKSWPEVHAATSGIFSEAYAVGARTTTEALNALVKQFAIHVLLGVPEGSRTGPIKETIGDCVSRLVFAPFEVHGVPVPEPPRR